MLSEDEAQLLADAYLLRAGERHGEELWAAVADEMLTEAHRLWAAGRLDRRWDRERREPLYRASDRLMAAQQLHALISDAASRSN